MQYEDELEKWTKEEEGRKERKERLDLQWQEDLQKWTLDRAQAKAQGLKLKDWDKDHPKPKQRDYKESGRKKPQMRKIHSLDDIAEADDDEEWEDDMDAEELGSEDEE